jgi:ribosomal protein S18 acetylase RimI-like enzyme
MAGILFEPSNSALAEAIEANTLELHLEYARSPQVELHEGGDLVWFFTGLPYAAFNRVLRARFEAEEADTRIIVALAPFRSHNVPLLWHTGPTTRPANLGECLQAHGLTLVEDEPGMALDLLTLDDDRGIPPSLTTERVKDLAGLSIWCELFSRAFEIDENAAEKMLAAEAALGPGTRPHRRMYLGRWDGEAVATSMLFLAAGVAGLHGVGTLPGARRQGIGRAMALAALLDAQAMGYRFGVLHASPMGLGTYRRLGFEEYCRLRIYRWSGKRQNDGMD